MIQSVLAISETKLAEVDGAPTLNAHDQNIPHDIVNILTPFEEATDFAQTEHISSSGYILPCIRHHWRIKYNSGLVCALKVSFERQSTNKIKPTFMLPYWICTLSLDRVLITMKERKELNEEELELRLQQQTQTSGNGMSDLQPPPAKKQKQKPDETESDGKTTRGHIQY